MRSLGTVFFMCVVTFLSGQDKDLRVAPYWRVGDTYSYRLQHISQLKYGEVAQPADTLFSAFDIMVSKANPEYFEVIWDYEMAESDPQQYQDDALFRAFCDIRQNQAAVLNVTPAGVPYGLKNWKVYQDSIFALLEQPQLWLEAGMQDFAQIKPQIQASFDSETEINRFLGDHFAFFYYPYGKTILRDQIIRDSISLLFPIVGEPLPAWRESEVLAWNQSEKVIVLRFREYLNMGAGQEKINEIIRVLLSSQGKEVDAMEDFPMQMELEYLFTLNYNNGWPQHAVYTKMIQIGGSVRTEIFQLQSGAMTGP